MNDLRSREEIIDSLQQNARGIGEDFGILSHSIQQSVSPTRWVRRNPIVTVAVGAGVVALTFMVITAGRNKLFRMVAGGAASAVGSVAAAQLARWVKNRVQDHLQPDEQEV